MPIVAMISGLAALIAGFVKYRMDANSTKQLVDTVSVSVGNQSIQMPTSVTPDQIAAIVSVLREKAATDRVAQH